MQLWSILNGFWMENNFLCGCFFYIFLLHLRGSVDFSEFRTGRLDRAITYSVRGITYVVHHRWFRFNLQKKNLMTDLLIKVNLNSFPNANSHVDTILTI